MATEDRTPILRTRFLEAPAKRKGNPFIACRVPRALQADVKKKAAAAKVPVPVFMKMALAKACGRKLSHYLDDEGEE